MSFIPGSRAVFLLLVSVPVFAGVDEDILSLKKQRDAAVANRIELIDKEYKGRLEVLKNRALREENLDLAVVIAGEIKSPGKSAATPAPVPVAPQASATSTSAYAPGPAVMGAASGPAGAAALKKAIVDKKDYWKIKTGTSAPVFIVFHENGQLSVSRPNVWMKTWDVVSPTELHLQMKDVHDGDKPAGYRTFLFDPASGKFTFSGEKTTSQDKSPCILIPPEEWRSGSGEKTGDAKKNPAKKGSEQDDGDNTIFGRRTN